MFRRILVGLDGSPLGQLAFQTALELACRYRAKLIALSVVEEPVTGNHEYHETESQQFYCHVQTNACAQARAAGITLQTVIGRGRAARADMEFRLSIQQELGVEAVAQQLHRLEAGGKTASDIMTPRLRTITADTPVLVAIRTMADHGMKRLPVVDAQGCLAGILSRADVLRAVAAGAQLSAAAEDLGPSPGASLVGDLMLTEIPTVRPEAPIDEVVHLILNSPTRRVVVTSPAGVVQGIITDRQLLARAAADLRPGFIEQLADLLDAMAPWRDTHRPLTANDLMHTDVFTVRVDEPIIHAIRLLMQLRVKRLVVVDAGRHLEGIVDRHALLQWLAQTPSR